MHALRCSSASVVLAGRRGANVRKAVLQPAPASRRASVRSYALLSFLFPGGKEGGKMGNKHGKGWQPATADTPKKVSKSGYDVTPLTEAQRQEAAKALSDFQKQVTLSGATERAFTGKTANGYSWDAKGKGVYVSAIGDLPLFTSDTKFNSGTGWPSYYAPVDPDHILEVTDYSIPYMPRVEVVDARSGAHLGHVFDDGPAPTGKRYCINAAALKFIPEGEPLPPGAQKAQ